MIYSRMFGPNGMWPTCILFSCVQLNFLYEHYHMTFRIAIVAIIFAVFFNSSDSYKLMAASSR